MVLKLICSGSGKHLQIFSTAKCVGRQMCTFDKSYITKTSLYIRHFSSILSHCPYLYVYYLLQPNVLLRIKG